MSLQTLSQNWRVRLVFLALLVALGLIFLRDGNPATMDLNLGIEFIGGVRIPVSLEKSVDAETMSSMVETIKTRINKFGLSQAVVRPLGDKQIVVEIPRSGPDAIKHVEGILREQGHFEAIVDGELALDGEDILQNSVGGSGGERVEQEGGDALRWELVFAISGTGETKFAQAAKGKMNYPVYMFLDRPSNAIILFKKAGIPNAVFSETALAEALRKKGDDLQLFFEEDFEKQREEIAKSNATTLVASKDVDAKILSALREMGFNASIEAKKRLVLKPADEMIPEITSSGGSFGEAITSSWPAIGLKSAPILNVEPIGRAAITQYSITGSARQGKTAQETKENALNELRALKSVLSGGRLPVATSIGSYYEVAPSLGQRFMDYTVAALLLTALLIAAILAFKYKRLKLVLPMMFTSAVEMLLSVSIIGSIGSLDLGAMAGIIALIGSGVDNQIIITDEVLKKKRESQSVGENQSVVEQTDAHGAKERVKNAFYVIFVVAGVSLASMLPLVISGITEVKGFALATILGVVLGLVITRPAFGIFIQEIAGGK